MESLKPGCELPSREKGAKVCLGASAVHSLQSGLRARLAEFWRFPAIFGGMQPGVSASQTAWRRALSRANHSPPKFPAHREKYRNLRNFAVQNRTPARQIAHSAREAAHHL